MRYILSASLALSDFLCLIFINSFRIASFAYENWLYGDTMCQLNAFLARYFYLNTVLHVVAISYERYDAIVKSPLTYDGTITKWKVFLIFLLWAFPILPLVILFFQFEGYKYDSELIFCDLGHVAQSDSSGVKTFACFSLGVISRDICDNRLFKLVGVQDSQESSRSLRSPAAWRNCWFQRPPTARNSEERTESSCRCHHNCCCVFALPFSQVYCPPFSLVLEIRESSSRGSTGLVICLLNQFAV